MKAKYESLEHFFFHSLKYYFYYFPYAFFFSSLVSRKHKLLEKILLFIFKNKLSNLA